MTDIIVGVIVAGAFVAWWLLSLVFQLNPRWLRRLKRRDVFHLLPKWTFFAPRPKVYDYNFLYRDLLRDGTFGDWIDVTIAKGGPIIKWLWNPRKRLAKGLGDSLRRERELRGRGPLSMLGIHLESTTTYRRLHHFFWRQPSTAQSAARQFIVTKTAGYLDLGIEPKTVFLSEFRPLHRGGRAARDAR